MTINGKKLFTADILKMIVHKIPEPKKTEVLLKLREEMKRQESELTTPAPSTPTRRQP